MAKAEANRKVLDSYARESSKKDKHSRSVPGQHASNKERITDLGAEVGELLEDKGTSAWVKGVRRPGWEKLINRLESGASDGAVIFDVERLLRRVEDALMLIKLAERGFVIYDSDSVYDLTSPQGRKAFVDAANAAEYYSDRLSSRVQRGNRFKALAGEGRHGRYRPFGFDPADKTMVVNEREAQAIRYLYDRLLDDHWSWSDCIEWLTDGQFLTTSGGEWSVPTVRSVLLAPRVAGKVRLDEDTYADMQGEPIIDPSRWHQLKALIESRRGRPPSQYHLCSGVKTPVRCSCGGILVADVYQRDRRYDDGERKRIYRCKNEGRRIVADQRALDSVIAEMMFVRLESGDNQAHLSQLLRDNEDARQPHEAEILRLEKTREHWDNRLTEGKMSIERYDQQVAEIEKRLHTEQQALERIGTPDIPQLAVAATEHIRDRWDSYTPKHKRELLRRVFAGYEVRVTPGSSQDSATRVSRRVGLPKRLSSPG